MWGSRLIIIRNEKWKQREWVRNGEGEILRMKFAYNDSINFLLHMKKCNKSQFKEKTLNLSLTKYKTKMNHWTEMLLIKYLIKPIKHLSFCINMHMWFKWSSCILPDNISSKQLNPANKNLNNKHEKISLSSLAVLSKKTPKSLQCISIAFVTCQRWKINTWCWTYHVF